VGNTHNIHWGNVKCIQISVEKPVGKRSLGRTQLGWEDNIKTDLKQDVRMEIGFNCFRIGSSGVLLLTRK
jgi:hypothetical protein